jgi:integrase
VLRKYVMFFRPTPALPSVREPFLSEDGNAMSVNALEMIIERASKKTGIKRLHAHLLRHTYCIRSQEQGVPTITLQHFMGHSSSKVTERYTHAAQSEKLMRARGYSTVDQLGVTVGKPRKGKRKCAA